MELNPQPGILQPPVALICPDPCSTSSEPPGTLRNLLMRSNYGKFLVFNKLRMHNWRARLNPPEKMYITLHKISDELHTWSPYPFPHPALSPLPNIHSISALALLFPLCPHLPSPRFHREPWTSAAPYFKNSRTHRALLTDGPGWSLSNPSQL